MVQKAQRDIDRDLGYIEYLAMKLIRDADRLDVVVEIALKPTVPFRMGGYESVISVRPKRQKT